MHTANKRTCFYCGTHIVRFPNYRDGARQATRDHIVAKSKGGFYETANTVHCCAECNGDKGSLNLEEYRLVLAFRKGIIGKAHHPFPGEMK